MAKFTAVIDTCVLYSSLSRDLLLQMAEQELYRPIWSELIIEELSRNLQQKANLTQEQTLHLTAELKNAFPEAIVTVDLNLVQQLQPVLPDPGDAHVISVAITGRADAIVTCNMKHFPRTTLERYQLEAIHPDDFLVNQWDLDENGALLAAEECHRNLRRNPPDWFDWLARLENVNLRKFASLLRKARS